MRKRARSSDCVRGTALHDRRTFIPSVLNRVKKSQENNAAPPHGRVQGLKWIDRKVVKTSQCEVHYVKISGESAYVSVVTVNSWKERVSELVECYAMEDTVYREIYALANFCEMRVHGDFAKIKFANCLVVGIYIRLWWYLKWNNDSV